ncbi:unnamed protein product, partial [marine sediment metagenome]
MGLLLRLADHREGITIFIGKDKLLWLGLAVVIEVAIKKIVQHLVYIFAVGSRR